MPCPKTLDSGKSVFQSQTHQLNAAENVLRHRPARAAVPVFKCPSVFVVCHYFRWNFFFSKNDSKMQNTVSDSSLLFYHFGWRHDTQHNDTQHNNTTLSSILGIKIINARFSVNNTQHLVLFFLLFYHFGWRYNTQHNDTQHNNTTLSIVLGITIINASLSVNNT
jgi:hypothetical protein